MTKVDEKCSYCDGYGKVDKNGNPPNSPMLQCGFIICPVCKGKGKIVRWRRQPAIRGTRPFQEFPGRET